MDTVPSTDKIFSRRDGVIGHIIFNNPERHNAVSLYMWDAVEEILTDLEADQDIRVLVLSGAGGKSFVSGADISKFDEERSSAEAIAHYNERIKRVYDRILRFPKPTITMINGYCLGGGRRARRICRRLRRPDRGECTADPGVDEIHRRRSAEGPRHPRSRRLRRHGHRIFFSGEDYIEGRTAFMEKRKPVFKGR